VGGLQLGQTSSQLVEGAVGVVHDLKVQQEAGDAIVWGVRAPLHPRAAKHVGAGVAVASVELGQRPITLVCSTPASRALCIVSKP
jgi:hypothetical protein